MFNKLLLVAAISTLAASAFALDNADVQKAVQLKDGATVYIFKDGKMAMEDQFGRPERMTPGHIMEAKDGQNIVMQGDEIARLEYILASDRGG